MKIVFICWHQDVGVLNQLLDRLTILRADSTPCDSFAMVIESDETVDPASYGELESAQVVCPIITANFLAIDWGHLTILRSAVLEGNTGERLVIPIRIEPCNFAASEWAQFEAVPADNLPASEWGDANKAHAQIDHDLGDRLKNSTNLIVSERTAR